MDGVDVGRHARVRRAIVDKGVHIPAGMRDRLSTPRRTRAASPSDDGHRGGAEGGRFDEEESSVCGGGSRDAAVANSKTA